MDRSVRMRYLHRRRNRSRPRPSSGGGDQGDSGPGQGESETPSTARADGRITRVYAVGDLIGLTPADSKDLRNKEDAPAAGVQKDYSDRMELLAELLEVSLGARRVESTESAQSRAANSDPMADGREIEITPFYLNISLIVRGSDIHHRKIVKIFKILRDIEARKSRAAEPTNPGSKVSPAPTNRGADAGSGGLEGSANPTSREHPDDPKPPETGRNENSEPDR